MKIYGAGRVLVGLIIFLVLALFPFLYYYAVGKAHAKPEPKVDTPAILQWEKEKGKKECVEPKAFMRAEHMRILDEWRDAAVRNGERIYVNGEGKQFTISLQNTCMHCHSNKKEFCDTCHNYVAVKPYCWSCHIAPKEDSGGVGPVAKTPLPPALARIYFESGKADLPEDASRAVAVIVEYVKTESSAQVVISGYTDRTGSVDRNVELAKNRAKAVRELLKAGGIAEDRIIMKKPVLITGTGDNREARRVEVMIVTGKEV